MEKLKQAIEFLRKKIDESEESSLQIAIAILFAQEIWGVPGKRVLYIQVSHLPLISASIIARMYFANIRI